ncbi:type II toxin-antitoxin system HicA family toxin [Pseudomonas baetica]|uniref:type II toxin-antitoxin system HicA family toxin n=1 Tax=Pseudomonas baetica TaxID=674054 RepID=UPI0028936FDC|nr:type II toxin-antitoxin system HicA family toxin [Pseudomonas baetica]
MSVRGRHHHFKHPTKPGLVTVPHPKKDLLKKFCSRVEFCYSHEKPVLKTGFSWL